MSADSVSLSQLVTDVKITLQSRYETAVWVVAEISDMNINRSGHCYMELIEKDPVYDRIIAKSRATIWAFTFRTIKAYFETTTNETLRGGLKVLLKASVEFHEVYGFSLNIQDIDPQYTMGDMARKKAQIIKQLDTEGVLEMNKSLQLPIVCQRIAVISSETAAGYGDFSNQLANNSKGYSFHVELFPAIMQGEKASDSIIQALENVFSRIDDFDVVAIMRGGGSKSDLSCFDDYDLSYFITQFPLSVITGIGHERDDTVTDLVAHTRLKTPTAVAEFLINHISEFEYRLDELGETVIELANEIFNSNENYLESLTQRLQLGVNDLLQTSHEFLILAKSKVINESKQNIANKEFKLENYNQNVQLQVKGFINQEVKLNEIRQQRLSRWLNNYFSRKERRLKFLGEKASLVNPDRILERGFAWVTHNGKIVEDSSNLKVGDDIEITLAKGSVEGEVKKLKYS